MLIYLLLSERKLVILADRGVEKIAHNKLAEFCNELQEYCADKRYSEGVVEVIQSISAELEPHFPRDPSDPKLNELPNKPKLL